MLCSCRKEPHLAIGCNRRGIAPPDLSPLNYCIWSVLEEAVYECRRQRFDTLEELRAAIVAAWQRVTLDTIRRSILQWKKRLNAVVRAEGGAIAHVYK